MKSFADIKQCAQLSLFLPVESADMCYCRDDYTLKYDDLPLFIPYHKYNNKKYYLPCWSLAALLSVIPQEIFDGEYVINITEGCDDKWVLTYDHCDDMYHSYYELSSGANNLVDACYAIILKLHKQKLL